ncbi:hypothetical protein Scep_014274 [Stephania cephalantha]|uniref:Uncharacterized protein n=1 Tax=Stephania cephalantha TaxID=152367 RepID=A0AAP0J105_9MAGN
MGGVSGLGPAQLASQAISLVLGGASVLYTKEGVRLPPSAPLSPLPFQVSPPKPKDLNRNVYKMSGRKETVLDLAKFVDKGVQVKLTGGRQGVESDRVIVELNVAAKKKKEEEEEEEEGEPSHQPLGRG